MPKRKANAHDEARGAKRPTVAKSDTTAASWSVLRIGAKDKAQRQREGGLKSSMRKLSCETAHLQTGGVIGQPRPRYFDRLRGRTVDIADFNNYRAEGHAGRFKAGTNDRAVSIVAFDVYEALRRRLPDSRIVDGDLGENILIAGPSLHEGVDLRVGQRLRLGTSVIEITEANGPCYRLNRLSWAPAAQVEFSADMESPAESRKWYGTEGCPLSKVSHLGGRGWLCKVVHEGVVAVGDTVTEEG